MKQGVIRVLRDEPSAEGGQQLIGQLSAIAATDTMAERMRGLLGRAPLSADAGLWISPCNSIHMFFMAYAIDVLYLDKQQRVCRSQISLKPWRASFCLTASSVIELAAGTIASLGVEPGDYIQWEPSHD